MSVYGEDPGRPAARCGASIYRNATQTINNVTSTPVTLDTVAYNDVGMWNVASPTKIVIPVAGYYALTATVTWAISAAGTWRSNSIYKNGGTVLSQANFPPDPAAVINLAFTTGCFASLNTGDYIEMYVYQNSGGTMNIVAVVPASIQLGVHKLP